MAEKMQNGCTTPHMRSSENAVKAKFNFAEDLFHALG
jgi:hypothetical protein